MKKEQLIEKLQALPDGIEVCVFDFRKNIGMDDGDGSKAGIYPEFDVEVYELTSDEREYFKERHETDFVDFACLEFMNEDYDDDGKCLLESED